MKEQNNHIYDMVIIGGGPAGYAAALYAARAGLDALVVERLVAGGQLAQTHWIDNYPGYEEGVEGYLLAEKMKKQAQRFGAKSKFVEVTRLDLMSTPKIVETAKEILLARTVVLATGANPKPLGLADEEKLVGRGVAYCASCDGMFYRNKTVAVVGGGNSAAEDALLLSRIAKRVILIHRRDSLRATKIYHNQIIETDNIEFKQSSIVTQLLYGEKLAGIRIKDLKSGTEETIEVDGLFVSIGRRPAMELVRDQVLLDENGYIIAGEDTKTGIAGVFAIGDIRTKQLRQVVTAVSDGAISVHNAQEYLAQ